MADIGSTKGTALSIGANAGGNFYSLETAGDHDWFKVSLKAGYSYVFTLRGLDSDEGTLTDPILRLRDGSGAVIKTNDDHLGYNDSEIIFVAPSTGTYYLDASSVVTSETGTYALATGERVDLASSNPGNVKLWVPKADIIQSANDKDWFTVHLVKGHDYALGMTGAGGGLHIGSLPDAFLQLYDPSGTKLLKSDNDSGFGDDARILFTPNATGDYILVASSNDGQVGTYWMYAGEQTGAKYVDALLPMFDQAWAPDNPDAPVQDWHWTISYSFMLSAPYYASAADKVGFQVLSTIEQAGVRQALEAWEVLTNIDFVEVPDSDDVVMRFGANTGGPYEPGQVAAYAQYPDDDKRGGDVYLNVTDSSYNDVTPGHYGYSVLLHEIGHALGLKHPGNEYIGDIPPFLPAASDTQLNSVMSYNRAPLSGIYPTTPMIYDADAIQYLYGANMTLHAGNDVYTFSNGAEQLFSIWDPSGVDTFDLSDHTEKLVVDLREFHFSSIGYGGNPVLSNVGIINGTIIEKALGGSNNDEIIGNQAKNTLTGNDGNDTLDGGAKADLLRGGAGDDTLLWDKADATLAGALKGDAGSDTLELKGGGKTLDLTTVLNSALKDIEVIDITGTGNNTLKVAAADVAAMNVAGEVVVDANAGDRCILAGTGWSHAGTESFGGAMYDHFVNTNGASLLWATAGNDIVI